MRRIAKLLVLMAVSCLLVGCGGKSEEDLQPADTRQPEIGVSEKQPDAGDTDEQATQQPDAGNTDEQATRQPDEGNTDEQATQQPDAGNTEGQSEIPDENSEVNGGEHVKMEEIQVEIKCPAEYSGKKAGTKYSNVLRKTYYSTTCAKTRKVNIVLPADYTEDKKYPVLYILHGIFGSENDMNWNSDTIQNMMTGGLAEEMIVVYPYMYASKTQDTCTAIDEKNVAAYDNFINDLVTDLMPYVKENYSIKEGKDNTAIAGFSMGGREALAIGLQRPDLFGYVCGIAPAPGLVPGRDYAMDHKGQFQEEELIFGDEKPYVLMVCCGDKDGTVGKFPKSYHEIFTKNGVEHIWWEIPGSDHGDPAISSGIYNFCKYVFK